QIGSIILTAITEIGEFLAGDFFPDLLTFFSAPLGMIKNYLSNFPYAVLAVVVINLFLVVVVLALAEKMLGVFDALDRANIANQLKQFLGRAIITPKVRKPVVAQDIIRPNAENHIAPPISFAQAFITVSLLAFLAYSLPQKYELANLINPTETLRQGEASKNATEENQKRGNQDAMNRVSTGILGESTKTNNSQRIVAINSQGQLFILPKSISSKEIKNHTIKNQDLADDSIISNTIKNHTIRSIDLQRELTIEELKVNQNLTVRGNLTTEGSLTAVDMNLSGNLDLQDNLILNIGNQNTDFTNTGGLNLADNLNINNNFLANATTGNITAGTYNGNTITNGTGTLTLDSYTLTLANNSQLNQNLLTTSTPQFTRLGLGIATDTTNILTATSSSTTDLSKTLNISHTGAITGTGYAGYFSKTGVSTTNVGLYTIATGATNNYALQVDSDTAGANNYTIYANGTAKNYFAGNIGIGSTAPSARLQVVGTDSLNTSFAANIAGATGTGLIVTNSGNVGIGTTGPGAKLDVAGKIAINGTQMIYLPDQTNFANSMYLGNGGASLSHTTGTEGQRNLYAGIDAGLANTTGSQNAGFGWRTLGKTTTGIQNSAMGIDAMYANIGGSQNSAMGSSALYANTSGAYNSAVGNSAMAGNTSGADNSAIGAGALQYNTTGADNIAVGAMAGRYYGVSGTDQNQTGSQNIFIGRETRASANGDTNEIVIGHNALGIGSNTITLGNNSIVTTAIKGNVGIGTTGPDKKLQIVGTSAAPDFSTDLTGDLRIGPNGEANIVMGHYNGNYSWIQAFGGKPLYINPGGNNTVLNATAGNVGIGTTTPGYKLDVAGDVRTTTDLRLDGADRIRYAYLNYNSSSYPNYSSYLAQTGAVAVAGSEGLVLNANTGTSAPNYGIGFAIDGSNKMLIQYTGNVGIGTTGPGSLLEIKKVSIDGITVDLSNDYNMMVMKVAGT
ncbi:MAG: hypothetical protein WAZ78_04230, partial [Candidatus Moraniibacteriota bacterium]